MSEKPGTLRELMAARYPLTSFPLDDSTLDLPILHGPERVCPECLGEGSTPESTVLDAHNCRKCHGTGRIREPVGIVSQEALEAAEQLILEACEKAHDQEVAHPSACIRAVLHALGIEVADSAHDAEVARIENDVYALLRVCPTVPEWADGDRVTLWVKRVAKEGE